MLAVEVAVTPTEDEGSTGVLVEAYEVSAVVETSVVVLVSAGVLELGFGVDEGAGEEETAPVQPRSKNVYGLPRCSLTLEATERS